MAQRKKAVKKHKQFYKGIVTAALLANGIFQFIAPVLAAGTTAGTSISNTATATYEDPNNPGTTIDATSNTVVVEVAEVAGITVTGAGTPLQNDVDGDGKADAGDTIYFNYTVTNVGNDPTQFRIPNLATTTGPATVTSSLEYSIDGGSNWVKIDDPTNTPGATEVIIPNIPVNGTVQVRVPVTVAPGAQPGDVINVKLGDTPGDDQNQLRNPDGGDVYTVDHPTSNPQPIANEVNGDPVNGVREASATQQITVDESLKTYALAKVLKERSDYNNAQTQTDITDDTLTYDLSLQVEQNDPYGTGINPAPLVGTPINGLTGPRILVSDAIPAGTDLASVPVAPPGWEVVYTQDPVTIDANAATWNTNTPTTPAEFAAVTRVGFVNNPNIVTSVNPGPTVGGFQIKLKVEAGQTAPLTINNIAQLFGSTPDNDNDPTNNPPVYDESGDQNPSNFNDDGTPLTGTDTTGPGGNPDGIPDTLPGGVVNDGFIDDPADETAIGVDSGNNNSATGSEGGEINQFVIDPSKTALVNGPEGSPDAIGPTDNPNNNPDKEPNDNDFTNKSSLVPPGTAPDEGNTIDPSPVGFTNTVENGSGTPSDISLLPTAVPGVTDVLPNGTKVTITYGSESKTYTWNSGAFDNLTDFITIPQVPVGTPINYGVEVDLPPGTNLSTDLNTPGDESSGTVGGFPVPIRAFVDNDGNPGFDGTETNNITIDRVYTGFLRLVKESRILPGDGPAVLAGQETFSTAVKQPSEGNIIEYRITYTNISDAQAGSGNVILNADKVVVEDDGTTGGNNWALDNDGDNIIDTSNIVGSAKDSGNANIKFFSGNPATNTAQDQTGTTADTDVSKYVDEVTGNVAPGQSNNFTFQRKVN